MKTTYFILFFSLISITIWGQISEDYISIEDEKFDNYFQNRDIATVKGKILNLSKEDIKEFKINYVIVVPFANFQSKKNCKLNADGSFELQLDNAFPYQQIWLTLGELFFAGIYAHTDLFIELDAKTIKNKGKVFLNGDGVRYLGADGKMNEYLNNHVLFKREEQLDISSKKNKLMINEDVEYNEFNKKNDSLYSLLNDIDNEFIKLNPSIYSKLIVNERKSDYYGSICVKNWGKTMSPELFDKIKNHPVHLMSNSGVLFNNYLYNYIYGTIDPNRNSGLKSIDTLIIKLDSIFPQSKSDVLKLHLRNKKLNEKKVMMEVTMKSIQTNWCKKLLQEEYDESFAKSTSIKEILKNANPSNSKANLGQLITRTPFGAKLYKVDTLNAKKLLANLKIVNNQKAMLIDFWATWCGPCIKEMPHSKKLQNETKDLPIEFIYLCTSQNSSIENWKSMIEKLKIGGTHLFVEQEIESELMSLFSTSGFPSYAFINKKGIYKPGAIKTMSDLTKNKIIELIE